MAPPYLPFLIFSVFFTIAGAQVPVTQTFHYTVNGTYEFKYTEYEANYRIVRNQAHSISTFPFELCFYNTTPNAFVLAIKAGIPTDDSHMRWVWDANRDHPVREKASLSLRRDGNLVLADADGSLVWQTATANRGVVGLKLLPNGNLVLHDKTGRFIWQSFDHPTDTLLAGQSLRINGHDRLISRSSDSDGSNGPYGIRLDREGFNSYINVNTSGGRRKPLVYGGWRGTDFGSVITFDVVRKSRNPTEYELVLAVNQNGSGSGGRRLLQVPPTRNENQLILNKLNYNATYSFLRLGSDGNLRAFTYYDKASYLRWTETFAYFSSYFVSECQLPTRCGTFGLCERGMCVACPSPRGLLGWSDRCAPPHAGACNGMTAAGTVDYYKIVGVDHFLSAYLPEGNGTMKVEECRERCSRDCECVGFFYEEDSSRCLLAPYLGTLISIEGETGFVGYIKYTK
ncbi:EP1-like glycoprotein 2 [Malania oleifera]|uniref:EP1-like glycoprotein 2 n=1 Tax=Malania oleifera TaxID=397392 RepID=UPI0025AE0CF4|nr:EP1-like glycoprotein 2 [Malania oleifera]